MIAVAAKELNHKEKYLKALEEMHKRTPQTGFALEIANLYKEMGNDAKYVEWTEIVLKAPPDDVMNYQLHRILFGHYVEKKNSAKMIEYAHATLKAIDKLQNPPAEIAKELPDFRRDLNHRIGAFYLGEKKYDEAIAYFMKALKVKKYADGYFQIGQCLWAQQKVLNARLAFAKAQLLGESAQANSADKSIAPRAKDNMERVHKSLQNNTLTGIERQYKRAQEATDEDLIKPME
jgi:tetratricopeptide (TPR) repeat protein